MERVNDNDNDNPSTNNDNNNNIEFPAVTKAAALIRTSVGYADRITQGSKEPDKMGKDDISLCSTPYKYQFHACRIPAIGKDFYRVYNPYENRHIIVACRGRFFELPIENKQGQLLPRAVIENMLLKFIHYASNTTNLLCEIGWMTTCNRNEWAKYRSMLLEKYGQSMEVAFCKLESAMLLLNLDFDKSINSLQEEAEHYWHGGMKHGGNRWWDKPIQLVVTKHGKWGYIGEHTMADGLVPVGFCNHLLQNATLVDDSHENDNFFNSIHDDGVEMDPELYDLFYQATKSMNTGKNQNNIIINNVDHIIEISKQAFSNRVNEHTINVVRYKTYGSRFIKQNGISPDAFVQLAIQLASFRLFGKSVATYEANQVRKFLHGRTETTRTVSPFSVLFCKAMGLNHHVKKYASKRQLKEILKLLKEATVHHVEHSKNASNGRGVDRHFFGLSMMLEEENDNIIIPDLFTNPVYIRSKHWRLSTSTLSTFPGFGMVVDDGLGVGYAVKSNELCFNVAGRADRDFVVPFCQHLENALDEMMMILPGAGSV